MASTQQLKRRIGSVKNTKQITKAMELVAASKMRRAQENALRSRDFRNLARSILTRISELTDVTKHPLYLQRPVKSRLYILITSDRGLAGAYNSNLLRLLTTELRADQEKGVSSQVILIGKQGAKFVSRFKDVNILGVYSDFPEHPTSNDIRPILNSIIERFTGEFNHPQDEDNSNGSYLQNITKKLHLYTSEITEGPSNVTADQDDVKRNSGKVDVVDVFYTDYKSSINQVAKHQRLLPAVFRPSKVDPGLEQAVFEPSVQEVLDNITQRLVEVQLEQALLESKASEHSMRMMAMKSASDNASDIIDDLTLEFNTARQASITQELAEITGGAEAIK